MHFLRTFQLRLPVLRMDLEAVRRPQTEEEGETHRAETNRASRDSESPEHISFGWRSKDDRNWENRFITKFPIKGFLNQNMPNETALNKVHHDWHLKLLCKAMKTVQINAWTVDNVGKTFLAFFYFRIIKWCKNMLFIKSALRPEGGKIRRIYNFLVLKTINKNKKVTKRANHFLIAQTSVLKRMPFLTLKSWLLPFKKGCTRLAFFSGDEKILPKYHTRLQTHKEFHTQALSMRKAPQNLSHSHTAPPSVSFKILHCSAFDCI